VKGTISHSKANAIVVVTGSAGVIGVGIDIEDWIDASLIDEIAPQVANLDERALLKRVRGVSESQAFAILFSAKESFFKAAYGLVQRYFDFHAVELVSIDVSRGHATLQVRPGLHPLFDGRRAVGARFQLNQSGVTSFLAI
jgi:4'-phosphopantetheinyl transferase EntD